MFVVTNTVYVWIIQILLYISVGIPFIHIVSVAREIGQFYNLPLQQVGGFTVNGWEHRLYETIACCGSMIISLCITGVCSIRGINVTDTPGDTQFVLGRTIAISCSVALIIAIYILFDHRDMYKQIARRTSIIYLTTRYPSITYHNADVFCDHFGIDVFPVKTFDRIQYEKPTLTLYDFEKILTDTCPYIELMNEVKDTSAQLRCLQPITTTAQC